MSRRSSRRAAAKPKASSIPPGVKLGFASLVEGNEELVSSMLSRKPRSDESEDDRDSDSDSNNNALALAVALTECMSTNQLSAEAFLARFFTSSVLGTYCTNVLGVSGKGNEATLAARIARQWTKPGFFDPRSKKACETNAAATAATAAATTRSARESSSSPSSSPKKDTIAKHNKQAVEQLDGKVESKAKARAKLKPKPKGSKPKKRAGSSGERVEEPTRDGKPSDDSNKKSRTMGGSDKGD
mmetsp:Transcript_2863/g.6880  ORF Transcript_2863/g.6880 Transcript_2863/m.6880 type:complete len:243 (+) Transcript_2863:131-859(+)